MAATAATLALTCLGDCLGDIAKGFLGKVGECLFAPILREYKSMFFFNSNITELETQLKKLETTKEGVQLMVDEARNNVRIIAPDVKNWLERANEVTIEVEGIIQEAKKAVKKTEQESREENREEESREENREESREENRGCQENQGWSQLRYSLSKKAVKITEVVVDLQAVGAQYTKLSYSPEPSSMGIIPNGDFTGFESRRLVMEEIIKALKNDEINLIGVCGMGGVGKTTLVNEVAKTVKERNHFDEVAMAKVGQKPDLTYVQACIADTLGLKNLRNTVSPIERANLLCKRLLQNNKKVLVILDDIWADKFDLQGERIDLQGMGIPLEGVDKNVKLLYTSRTQDLWHDLPTKQEIPLKILSEDEAWQLFRAKAGDSADAPDLQPIAKQIMNECGRLPLALVLIGSALSKKSERYATKKIWEAILYRLTHATSAPADKGLYSRLELSYEYLEYEQHKRLFLLCCLFEEDKDIRIEDLARYGLGLSLFDGILEMERVRSQVFLIVDDLKSRHLLLDGENKEECVKVHDVVRDMGISIASKNKFALVIHGEVSEWPKMDTDEHYTCISLISRKITELPRELTCPNLEFLLLDCRFLKELPCQFFEGMGKLKVLVVNDFNGILSLPSSLRNLHTLSLLFLDGKLDNVSGLGGLSSLKTLSFRYSQMEELPEEIGELVDLRLLDLTDNELLKRIPPNVISRLVDLEELYVGLVDFNLKELYLGGAFMAFKDWEGEGKEEEGRNANLRELELLSNLNTLEIGIRSDVLIPKVPIFSKLKIYKVIIFQEDYNYMEILSYWFAEELQDEMYNLFCKCERVFMVRSSIPIPSNRGGIDSLLRISDYLFLEGKGCNDLVQALLRPDGVDGLQKLKFLRIGRCDTPEYLANTRNLVHPPIAHVPAIFPILEVLHLLGPVNLRKICRGPVPAGSFGELTFIEVHNCGRLRNLFHLPIGGCLPQLKRLIINSCDMMEEVFRKEQQEANKIEFPKLEVLKLEELPSLVRFCRGIDQIDFPQLKELRLGDIPRVNLIFHNSFLSLFPDKVSLPNLEVLRVDKLENLERLGQRPLSVGSFSKLNKIFMRDCGKLLCVIPSQFVSMLRELQELTVESCNSLEVVFELEGLNSNEPNPTTRTKSIPQLHKLKVSSCEMLSRIVAEENGLGESSVDEVEFPLLERLELLNLPNLVSFFPNVNGNTTTLAKSTDQPHQPLFNKKVAFPSLEYLELSGLESVSDLWCSELPTSSFSKLKTLNVRGFPNLRSTFHLSMVGGLVGGLVNLSELVITDCSKMEGVVYWEEEIEDGQGRKVEKTLFPLLRKLQLSNLPNLVSFFLNVNTTLAKSTDHYHNPMQPQPLFNEKVAFPCLKYLGLSGLRNVSDILTSSFSKRKNLQVTDSTSLRNFPCILWIDDLNNTTQGLQEVAGLLYHKDLICKRVLALGSNGTMMMWKWEYDSEHNPSGEATARVLPDSGLAMTNDVIGVNLEEAVPCMALSEFNNDIISACGGKVSLYDNCKAERTFMPPPPASTFLAFCPQRSGIIAIGMEDSTICIYHRWEDKVKSELKGHEKRITGLAFSTILNTLVSSAADAQLCFWRIDTWEHLKSVPIQLPTGKACNGDTRVQFHSDQIRLLVSHETQLAIYDAFEMDRIRQWVPQDVLPAPISFAVYSCDSQLVYTSFCDGNIGVFDADSLTLGRIVPSMCLYPTMLSGGQAVYPRVIAAHPQKPNQFAIGLTNGSILLMEPQESEGKWELSPSIDNGMLNDRTTSSSNTSNHTLDKNGDGPMARSMEKPKTLDDVTDKSKPWKVAETRCQLVVMLDSTYEAQKVARLLYRNGCEVLALGCNGALRPWRRYLKVSASGLAMINDVTGVNLEEAVPCMALSKDYGNIISACGGKVSLFDIEKFKVIKKFMSPPPSSTFLAFHPQDDKIIAIGMEDSTIRIYNRRADKVRSELKGHEKRITGLAFSTELKRLVSSGADAQLCIWSIDTWEHLKSVPIQLPDGKACNGDTRVQFHSDQIHLLVSHETQLAIYDASKMDRIRQWVPAVPQDVLPAPISFAAYSCDSQIVYTSFCNGNIGVFDADSLTLTCHILPSVYFPTLSSGSQAVYPTVVATHPFKPNQFAIGLTNGSVILIEPPESEGKWGLSPTVYHKGMLNDRIASSYNISNHNLDQKLWTNQWYDVDSDEEDEDTDVEENEDMDEDKDNQVEFTASSSNTNNLTPDKDKDREERRVLKSRKRATRTITSTIDNVTLNDRTASSSNTSNHTPDQFHSVEEGDSATSSAHILPQASGSESGLTLPASEEIDLDANLQVFQFGTYPQQPKPECYRRQPQRPKPKHNRRHPPQPLLQEGEINSVVRLDESEGGVVP